MVVSFSRSRIAVVVAVLASCLAMPVLAQRPGGVPGAGPGMEGGGTGPEVRRIMPQSAQSDRGRSLSDAIRRVQRSTGGQILGAERVPFDGRNINRVKYLDDRGRVRYMDDTLPERSGPRAPRSAYGSEAPDAPASPRGDNW